MYLLNCVHGKHPFCSLGKLSGFIMNKFPHFQFYCKINWVYKLGDWAHLRAVH